MSRLPTTAAAVGLALQLASTNAVDVTQLLRQRVADALRGRLLSTVSGLANTPGSFSAQLAARDVEVNATAIHYASSAPRWTGVSSFAGPIQVIEYGIWYNPVPLGELPKPESFSAGFTSTHRWMLRNAPQFGRDVTVSLSMPASADSPIVPDMQNVSMSNGESVVSVDQHFDRPLGASIPSNSRLYGSLIVTPVDVTGSWTLVLEASGQVIVRGPFGPLVVTIENVLSSADRSFVVEGDYVGRVAIRPKGCTELLPPDGMRQGNCP